MMHAPSAASEPDSSTAPELRTRSSTPHQQFTSQSLQPPRTGTMSRHKIVKNLDLDEELDDYDGGDNYDDSYGGADGGAGGVEGPLVPDPPCLYGQRERSLTCGFMHCAELSEEDQQQMAAGTIAVREALGRDVPDVTDREIQEALWHYYYDVGQTVTYILDTRVKKAGGAKKEKKKKKGGLAVFHSCLGMGKREFRRRLEHGRLWRGDLEVGLRCV